MVILDICAPNGLFWGSKATLGSTNSFCFLDSIIKFWVYDGWVFPRSNLLPCCPTGLQQLLWRINMGNIWVIFTFTELIESWKSFRSIFATAYLNIFHKQPDEVWQLQKDQQMERLTNRAYIFICAFYLLKLSTFWLRLSMHVAGNPPPTPQKVAIEFYYIGASIKRLG